MKADPAAIESLLASFIASSPAARAEAITQMSPEALGELLLAGGLELRKAAFAKLPRDELARILMKITPRAMLALGRQGVAALGTYRAKLTKQERLRGKMLDPQTIEVTMRLEPRAFRLQFVAGPAAGRRVLYDSALRADEVRVKEPGLAGLAGAMWLQLDNPLTRLDTTHRATEIGLDALLELLERDMEKGLSAGGHERKDEGFNAAGIYTAVFDAPPGVAGLYASRARIGFDVARSLPISADVFSGSELLESHKYTDIEAVKVPDDFFTLRAASL